MAKYIHAGDLARVLCKCEAIDEHSANAVINLLYRMPTADVTEVKHGEWKHTVEFGQIGKYHYWNCSLCGVASQDDGREHYCFNCGAIMDE